MLNLLYLSEGGIIVAASHLINSAHWNGELWYFPHEENIDTEYILENNNALKYPLYTSVTDGVVLTDTNTKVSMNICVISGISFHFYSFNKFLSSKRRDFLVIFQNFYDWYLFIRFSSQLILAGFQCTLWQTVKILIAKMMI